MQQAQPNKLQITLTATSTYGIIGFNTKSKAKWQHKKLQQIQPTSWNKHHGRAITNINRGRATLKQDSCGHTKITIYNGNSQADSNLEHPKLRQRISRQTYWKPFTMAKPNNIRDQHPDEELWQITATQTATKTNNFNHDTHREDAKTRDHQDKTYPKDHTQERSIRTCETRKKKS